MNEDNLMPQPPMPEPMPASAPMPEAPAPMPPMPPVPAPEMSMPAPEMPAPEMMAPEAPAMPEAPAPMPPMPEAPAPAPIPEPVPAPEVAPAPEIPAAPVAPVAEPMAAAPAAEPAPAAPAPAAPASNFNIVQALVGVITKPVTTIKAAIPSFSEFKNSAIVASIFATAMAVANLITSIAAVVTTTSFSFSSFKTETKVDFGNLKNLNWGTALVTPLISSFAAIFVVSLLFFGFAKLFKCKQASYARIAGILALSLVPLAAGSIIAAIFNIFLPTIGLAVSTVASMYSCFIFYEGLFAEVPLEGDKKVFYLTACVLVPIVLITVMLTLFQSILSNIGIDITQFLPGGGLSGLGGSSGLDINIGF